MAVIPAARKLIDYLEVKYRSGVSESTWSKIGGVINFLLQRNHQEKQFFINGPYSIGDVPNADQDGLVIFEFDATIINVHMFNRVAGSSGTTQLDVRRKPKNSGAWASIFDTPPSIDAAAGDDVWVCIGDTVPDTVAPEFAGGVSELDVDAGDGLTLDLLQAQPDGENCGILIHYRPR